MTNRLFTACMTAWSEAFARALAPRRPSPSRQRRGSVVRALKPASLLLAAAALLVLLAADITSAPNAEAQDATITSLLSRLDVEVVSDASTQNAGYDASDSQGSLSPAGFNYPAGFGPWYTVEALAVNQGTTSNPTAVVISVRGTVTSVASSGDHRAHVLPSGASITLLLEGEDFSKFYSLKNPNERTVAKCSAEDGTERHCGVREIATEDYKWTTDLPPRLTDDESILVRLRYKAPRPGKPGTPTVTVPTGKSGALVVEWAAPQSNDPEVLGYQVYVTRGSQLRLKSVDASTTRLPVLLLEPDTTYDVRVRARTDLAAGPSSATARARTNPLQGTNRPQVTLDLNSVTKVKEGDGLPMRLKVTGMPNLHAGAFPERFEGEQQLSGVEFLLLDRIAKVYTYEDHPGGCSGGSFRSGALTIGDDGEVYHDSGYLVIPKGMSEFGPLYVELDTRCGNTSSSNNVSIDTTEQCVEIADSSNNVPTDRTCSPGGMSGHAVDRLTARFVGVPRSHDGESEFTLRVAFIEDVGISPTSLREDALTVTGGTVTQAQRVDDRSDLFEITVEPDSDEDVTITLAASSDCAAAGAICTGGEDPKKLYNSPAATVSGPTLTASFQGLPSQHDGETAFSFRIAFSDDIATGEEEFRDHSVEVWGGRVTRAEPVDQRRDLWEVEVEPASDDLVMISLRPSLSCDETGAVCTAAGRRLSVSPATMVAGPATWPVQVNGEAQVGKTLTADTSNISDRFGVQVTSMTYQWLANNARIPGASGQSYTLGEGKRGRKISVMATYTDDRGNEDTLTSGPTEPVAARERNSRATGLPLISGRALVGQTLTADTSLILDADGLENSVFSYLWEADDDSIPGAHDPTYTPVQADVGKVITVIVSFLDDAAYSQSMTSPDTMAVTTAEAAAAVKFAHSLRYAANADGSVSLYWNAPNDEATGYRILRRRSSMGEPKLLVYVADTGSAATAYTDTEVTAGVPHNYRVQAISDSGLGERSDFVKVFPLRKAANSPATGAPAISGVAQVGETLMADTSGIVDADGLEHVTQNYLWGINKGLIIGAVYGYQWLADEAEIEDATGSTYILADADEGKAIKVRVSFTDDGGHRETLTSSATAAVTQPNTPATGMPTVSGKARVGETLTVDTSGISDENGLDDATFTHQWITDDSVVVGTGTRAYTPTGGDQGKAVKVRVSFTDDAGNWETRTSAQTAAVAARSNSAGICDRTERVRDNIISLLNAQDLGSLGIKDCSEVTDEHLTRIRFLDLTGGGLGQKITSLKSGDFEGLSGMTELGLEHNSLSELPEGVFDGLSSLEILTMHGNDLGSLPDGVFDDLTNLDALALYDNDLAALPDGVFDELTELSTLAISDNKLTALSGDVFTGLAGLTHLVASNNKLTSLPDGVFAGMSKLQTVNLSGNPGSPFTLRADLEKEDAGGVVVKVAEGTPFAMTVTLSAEGGTLSATTVVIDGGDTESAVLTVTPEGAGAVTVSVDSAAFLDAGTSHAGIQAGVGESLTLEAAASGICGRTAQVRDAILEMLPDTSDCALVTETDLRSIDRLWLREKEITSLKSGDFSGLSNLQLLHLANNELSALPDGIFDNLTSLQSLYLFNNRNRLSELPDGIFDDLTGLEVLHLFGIGIRGLPDDIFDNLSGLRSLRLGANWISELPDGVFDNLTGLESLNLGINDLSELPDGVFDNLARLYSLGLGGNDLGELPDGIFDNLTGLGALTLTNIDLSELPDGIFDELTRLDTLVLSDNDLSELPDGIFDELTGLWTLKLDGNDLSELPDGVFDKLTRLRWLTLGDNDFSDLPDGVFDSLTRLDMLYLHRNELSELPDGVFDNLTELEDLYLLRNEFSRLPDGIFYGLANLNVLNIDDNAGSPFILTAELERTGENTIVLKIAQATPFDTEVTLSAEGGSLSSATVFIPAGNVSSAPVNVSPDGDGLVTISVVSAAFLLGESQEAKGIQTGLGSPLALGEDSDTNTPATGAPTISGTVQVGETLTADTSDIEDANGLANATFSYRWVSSDGTTDTDIEKATDSTYKLVADNAGKFIKVIVTFADDAGNEETLTSAPTAPVWGDGPPGAPGNLTVTAGDREITLSWEPPADNGNAPATRYRIEWRIDGKDYKKGHWGTSRSTTHTKTDLANGVKYVFRVKAENGNGNSYGPYGPASEEVSATPTSGSAVDLGTPVLSNTKTLHHGMVQLDWEDIEDAGWYVVQYYHVKSGEWLDLPTAGVDIAFHGSSAVVSNLHGLSWVRVRAASCAGESEWSQVEELYGTNASDWEDVAVPEVAEGDEIEPCPVVLGTPVLSNTKTLHHGMVQLDWQDIEDAGRYVVQYYHVKSGEWLDLPAAGVDIAFHGSSAVVSNLHGLSWLRVRAMSCAGESEWSQIEELYGTNASDWEGVPVPEVAEGNEIEPCSEDVDTSDNSPATGAPTVSGTAQVGETLMADTSGIADEDGLTNATYSYQWLADDEAISGGTGSTYTLTDSEEGKTVQIRVSFTDDAGNEESLTSAATDAVAAEPQPNSPATGALTITGTVQVGETLTADTSGIADADGLGNVQYEYQWLADAAEIAGATSLTYTLADTDEGKAIKVEVSFTDDAGNEETLTSAATDAVAAAATPNSPATGAPTISGTAQVGETLTANTSGVADADGLGNVQYEYRWLADDAEIAGATNATYTLAAADEGKSIKVQVSFADDAGNEESLTSGATDTVEATPTTNSTATGAPTISGTAQVGETLTANTSEVADADGLGNVQYEYRWLADDSDISGATNATYTPVAADEGKAIKVQVSFTDDAGNEESLTSAATDAVAAESQPNSPATGALTITGTVQVGETLTADTSSIADADGLGNVQYEYQWLADDAAISGATNSTYTLAETDEGKAIKVQVSFADDAGNGEALTSAATDAVAAAATPNSPATGAPTISGTAQVGETLTANTSEVADADGLGNVQYEYQWLADDAEIAGATNATYTLAAADEGKSIKVQVSFADDAGNGETLTSAATDAVAAAPTPNSPATGAPAITGTAQVGETLTADTSGIADADGLGNVQYEYQWLADDADISGATNATYILVDVDEGKAIKVEVTFRDDADNGETLTSAATDPVAAAPTANSPATGAPTITGTAQVGETLTANTSGIAESDGLGNVQYEYQWLADDAAISGATNSTYTLADTDEGKAIKVEVTFTDNAGNEETLTSAATDAVAAEPSEPPDKPTGLDATATHDSVTLTWDDPQDDSITGYVILRRVRVNDTGGDFSVLIANTGSAATTYTDNEVAASTTYTYRIKAINEHGVSERSRWVHIDTPAPPVPDKPTGLFATASHDAITLTWDDPGDDSITGYVIIRRHRYDDPEGHFDELVADTGTAATTYTDDTVAAETPYTYRIKAINEQGVSERSRWFHIDTPAAPEPAGSPEK